MTSFLKNKKNLYLTIALVILFVMTLAVAGGVGIATVVANTPDWNPESLNNDSTTFIYDKNGDLLATLHGPENRIPIKLKDIPKHVQNAFIAVEDTRFYNHKGVDLKAIARAAVANLRSNQVVEGGSTITQQLVKNAFLTPERTFTRKINEALLSYELEKNYTKSEILEMYLNKVYFGHGAYGIQAAAKLYFGKNAEDLSIAEGALLAGLVQSPNSYSPNKNPDKAKFRRDTVLVLMEKNGFLNTSQRKTAEIEGFELVELNNNDEWKHPYFIDYVIEYIAKEYKIEEGRIFRGGYKIYTTLDPKIQQTMEDEFADDKNFPKSKEDQLVQGSMTIIDHRTGEIKGLVGGREHEVKRGYNRATQAKRQPGSTFKPIGVYGPALDLKYPPNLILNDAPTTFKGNYKPKNANGRFMGPITMRTAVQWSVNLYAVKLLDLIGVDNGYKYAVKMGVNLDERDKVLPLALGGLTYGVTTLEMARAYGVFANQGVLVDSTPVSKILDGNNKILVDVVSKKTKVVSSQAAWLMTDLLRNVVNSGTGTAARMNRPVAGKTGTAQVPNTSEFRGLYRAHKDVWFVGYTPELVAAVWMGYDKTDREHYVSVYGGNNPAKMWRKVMAEVLKDVPVKQFEKPKEKFTYKTGIKTGDEESIAKARKQKEEEEKKKLEEEKLKQEEEQKKLEEEKLRQEEEQKKIDEQQKIEDEKRKQEEQKKIEDEKRKEEEEQEKNKPKPDPNPSPNPKPEPNPDEGIPSQ